MTTPEGVPNLPQGALTLETLAAKIQDMSATAMRGRVNDRVPQIFDNSTGGKILNDLSPFGILSGIWSGVMALIAAADPGDINGPEDLPPVLIDFIESLPFVGQFFELLEALLGTYTGDDENILAIQELFTPIRLIIQTLTGVAGGGIDDLAAWAEEVPGIGQLVATLTGQGTDNIDLKSLDISALGTWAQNLLTTDTPIPASNLFGNIAENVFGTIPVSHINLSKPNLLSQGAFNSAETLVAADNWEWDKDVTHSGSGGSAKVTCDSTARTLYSKQTVTVVEGDRLEAKVWVKSSTDFAGGSSSIQLLLIPFAGTTAQSPVAIASCGASSSWVEIKSAAEWEVPSGVTSVRVALAVTADATAGAVWFDDAWLNKAGLMAQGLVEFLLDAWNNIWRGAFGIPEGVAVTGKTVLDLISALANPLTIAVNVGTNLDTTTNTLKVQPGDILGTLGQGISGALMDGINTVGQFLGGLANAFGGAIQGTIATVGQLLGIAPYPLAQANQGITNTTALSNTLQTSPQTAIGTLSPNGIGGMLMDGVKTVTDFVGGLFGAFGGAIGGTITTVSQLLGIAPYPLARANQSYDQALNALLGNFSTNAAIYNGYFGGSVPTATAAEAQATIAAIKVKLTTGYTLQSLTYNSGSQTQIITANGAPTGGDFTLTYSGQTTASTAYNATAATVQTSVTALSTIGSGNATVTGSTGGPYTITLAPFVQTVTVSGSPTGGTFTLTYGGQTTAGLARNDSAATVQTALTGLSTIGSGKATVTGSAGGPYTVTFANTLAGISLLTASGLDLTGGTNPTVTVENTTSYSLFTATSSLTGGTSPSVSITPTWTSPWTSTDEPAEFYAIAFGSGGGGGKGQAGSSGTRTGGLGGQPGGYAATQIVPSTVTGANIPYAIAAGGTGKTSGSTAASDGAETTFGSFITTSSGLYYAQNLLGYYGSDSSAPGAGGLGGTANGGETGAAGQSTILATGGSGGTGFTSGGSGVSGTGGSGGIGGTASLVGGTRAGGAGGGGGGGAASVSISNTSSAVAIGGLGGNGGFPGGAAGGGGGALASAFSGPSNTTAIGGNGGNGAHGVIVLIWK